MFYITCCTNPQNVLIWSHPSKLIETLIQHECTSAISRLLSSLHSWTTSPLVSPLQVVHSPPSSGGISLQACFLSFRSKLIVTFWIPVAFVSMDWMNWNSQSVPINFLNSTSWRWANKNSRDFQWHELLSHKKSNSDRFSCSKDRGRIYALLFHEWIEGG